MNDKVADKLRAVSPLIEKLEFNVNNAVKALQFEEMTRQLITYRRIPGIFKRLSMKCASVSKCSELLTKSRELMS